MLSEEDFAELRRQIIEEVNVGPLAQRTHYSKGTYADGCRGPMCKKAERDSIKERQERKHRPSGLPYRPQTDSIENCQRDDFINNAIINHRNHRGFPKMPRRPVYPPGYLQLRAG